MSISGHERSFTGLELAAYTRNRWGKGIIESSGISPLDVQLKPKGESVSLGFFAFSSAVCSVRGALPCKDSPLAAPPLSFVCFTSCLSPLWIFFHDGLRMLKNVDPWLV